MLRITNLPITMTTQNMTGALICFFFFFGSFLFESKLYIMEYGNLQFLDYTTPKNHLLPHPKAHKLNTNF